MAALCLIFALQFQTPVRATTVDTVVAHRMLQAGLVAFDSVNGHAGWHEVSRRYMEQLYLWNMKDEGANAAFAFDSAVMRTHRSGATHNTYYWLSRLLQAGDSVRAEQFIARMPDDTRDEVLALVVKDMMHQRPAIASSLEARITRPWPRAEVLHHRAAYTLARTDSAAARAMLSQAINLARADTGFGAWSVWNWMIELVRLGGEVAIDDIVQVAARSEGDLWNARAAVAGALVENAASHLAAALIDSLAAGIERQEPARQPHSRMRLLQLRRTGPDSALATRIRDSLDTAESAEFIRLRQGGRQLHDLYQSANPPDEGRLRDALTRPASDTVLGPFLNHVRALTTLQVDVYQPTYRDGLSSYARVLIELTGPVVSSFPAPIRDSLQAIRAAILSYANVAEGLTFARSIATPRFRDRAVSEVITRLVRTNVDAAEREAASLRDPAARASAYGVLARAAVAGGRLSAAATFAANATGEARARAFFEVANTQQRNGLLDDARRSLTAALQSLDAEPRCDGCIDVETTPGAPPRSRGAEPALLAETAFLALRLGMREQLLAWTENQRGNSRQVNARLVFVEAMSRQLLGWAQGPRLR